MRSRSMGLWVRCVCCIWHSVASSAADAMCETCICLTRKSYPPSVNAFSIFGIFEFAFRQIKFPRPTADSFFIIGCICLQTLRNTTNNEKRANICWVWPQTDFTRLVTSFFNLVLLGASRHPGRPFWVIFWKTDKTMKQKSKKPRLQSKKRTREILNSGLEIFAWHQIWACLSLSLSSSLCVFRVHPSVRLFECLGCLFKN